MLNKTIMKSNKILIGAFFAFALTSMTTSCVDDWKFGDSFLEKAPGGDVTKDTIFNNAEYTRDFLWNTYSKLYYGIPYYWGQTLNAGMLDALSDSYHSHLSWDEINRQFYSGGYAPGNSGCFKYTGENVWEAVRAAYIFLENVDKNPDMETSEKERLKAEAKCIIATRYFDMFRHYGGLPIVRGSYSGTEAVYEQQRESVENTVDFMVGLLDEAAPNLPWKLDDSEASNWDGRFTKAAAEGLKCKILLFAASPLFNNDTPYAGSESDEANQKHQAWYGNYSAERWQKCLTACEKFFTDNNGEYALVQSEGNTPGQYRAAYRKAYSSRGTSEMLFSTRVRFRDDWGWNYIFNEWNGYGPYTPTEDYMEKFDWADGTPFDYDKCVKENGDKMFVDPDHDFALTRDPRLYETMIVNGMLVNLNDNGNMSGRRYEIWSQGEDGRDGIAKEEGQYAAGFGNNKFYYQGERNRVTLWPYLRMAEMYLIYAEALAQNGQLDKAIDNVNIVRARVGLKGLKESDPSKNWADKDVVIEAIMKERAVEMGFEEARYYDMVRYRRSDLFQKPLHGLRIYRQKDGQDYDHAFYGTGETDFPTHFRYEKYQLTNVARSWWSKWDNKWFLLAFPPTEINKGYGLTQNPGW